jgi:hypothetical protein
MLAFGLDSYPVNGYKEVDSRSSQLLLSIVRVLTFGASRNPGLLPNLTPLPTYCVVVIYMT